MNYLSVLLGSLLAMLGGHEPAGQASFVRLGGEPAVLSRTTVAAGHARFQCLHSASGSCFYRLYREECRDEDGLEVCRRQPLADFRLASGGMREMDGLPAGFGQQVLARK